MQQRGRQSALLGCLLMFTTRRLARRWAETHLRRGMYVIRHAFPEELAEEHLVLREVAP